MSRLTLYEHANKKGESKRIDLDHVNLNQVYSLKDLNMNDRMSSIEWDIAEGFKLIFYEHAEGQGRQYGISGKGSNNDLKSSKDFNDKASGYRFIVNNSVPEYFGVISPEPKIIKFTSTHSKHGTDRNIMEEHYQGIQALDDKHVIISMSDFSGAYFFVVRWKNGFLSGENGVVLKQVLINKDFPGMALNHPGCMQLMGNTVAIPIEFIGDTDPGGVPKSSIVFYDVTDRENPVKTGPKISRQSKPASAIGMVSYKNRVLLAVAGKMGQDIDFYRSQPGQTTITNSTVFSSPFKNWKWDENKTNTKGWVTKFWASRYESFNFIKDSDGKLYLVAFRYPYKGFNDSMIRYFAELYSVDIDASQENILKKISVKEIYCRERASTEFGSGVHIAGKRIHFLISGSGRSGQEYDNSVMQLNYFT